MGDNHRLYTTALEQYAIVKSIVKHLDFDSCVNVSRMSKLWHLCATQRLNESRVRDGYFYETDFNDKGESIVAEFRHASLVIFFGSPSNQTMERILCELTRNQESNEVPVLIGLLTFGPFIFKNAKHKVKSSKSIFWIAFPQDLPISVFSAEEFFNVDKVNSMLKPTTMLFTTYRFEPDFISAKRRKIETEVKSQIVGGEFDEVFCNHSSRGEIERTSFIAVSVSSIPGRLSVEYGETSQKSVVSDENRIPNLCSAIIFPCGGIAGRSKQSFLKGMLQRFPRCASVVGGFTGGEWFGRFTVQDLQDAPDLIDRVQHGYCCFYIAFVSI